MLTNSIRVVGDTHGINHKFPNRQYLAKEAEGRTLVKILADYTIQLGDIGWGDDLDIIKNQSVDKFKVVYGNHDDYDNILPHSLGDFGVSQLNGVEFAFVRGEYSIDKQYRDWHGPKKSWWEQEELSYTQSVKCIEFFSLYNQPQLMLSHGCPDLILSEIVTNKWKLNPSFTSQLLNAVYALVRPKLWIFGHHHTTKVVKYENTTFVCLNELCYTDLLVQQDKYILSGDVTLEVERT